LDQSVRLGPPHWVRSRGQRSYSRFESAYSQLDDRLFQSRSPKPLAAKCSRPPKKETVDKTYAEIDDELRKQYGIGYTPDKNADPAVTK
jgi:hypothetical protein